jgi:hypothetical protein
MIHPQLLLSRKPNSRQEGEKIMPYPNGLLFVGLVIRGVIGAVIAVAVLWLIWKLGKLADAYTEKLKVKQ